MRPLLSLLALTALLLVGCSDGEEAAPPPASEPTAAEPAEITDEDGTTAADLTEISTFGDIPGLVQEVAPSTVSIATTVERNGQVGQGAGSGVIWADDGVIVTNAHVVSGAQDIDVVLADGTRFPAEVIATDARTDLAALRIDADGLPAADFADELPRVGELALALGNPLGFENTATVGIVSGLDRSIPVPQAGFALVGLIQTDASISSGNSGGALVDARARVIGINVAALGGLPQGVAENVGFAIPSTTVTSVITQLVETGDVAHPFLGIGGATVTPQIAERFDLSVEDGVAVRRVEPDGPAAQAGLQTGDVIVELEGEQITSLGDLIGDLRDHQPGDEVAVTVVRDGQERTFEVTLGELPDQAVQPATPTPAP